ncbi:hypothetical protein [Coraliomargarita parva]|uniref:hypothetical protein n=1 Tax=Coraliomargarita parva TaxID=3014050 RepID=UPI0022B3F0BB|nr:hypothetical protein [Coraliomargarita parva]
MTVATDHPQALEGLTDFERRQLEKAVAQARKDYTPATRMLSTPFASPGYHTTYKGPTVHETRQSLKFAVALLDTGSPDDLKIAIDILGKVISLQDQDPSSETYGIWPWFLEESIQEMDPPDWNWADFCGAQLLEAHLTHADRLPEELLQQMDRAILNAARSIKKRDVPLGYTNIVIMGSFVCLLAGELLNDNELTEFASDRIQRFHDYTFELGTFSEYNSPPYTNVALNELRRLRRFVEAPELGALIDNLYELAWQEIALYFHPQTGQWSGPHSRCYETLLTPQIEGSIQRALGREDPNEVPTLDQHRLSHKCPEKLRHYFDANASIASKPRTLTKAFAKGSKNIIGTTYQHPEFSLGSVNYSDLNNQRRSLLAYWGKPGQVRSLRLRFLHDGYDFTAMQFYCAQQEGNILAALGLATDGGDRHPYFDRLTNGQFKADDLRLRFEVEGIEPKQIEVVELDSAKGFGRFKFDGLHFALNTIEATFGEYMGHLETSEGNNKFYIDLVFYSGPRRAFTFGDQATASASSKQVSIAFTASIASETPGTSPMEGKQTSLSPVYTKYSWKEMEVVAPTTPAPLETMTQDPKF